MKTKRAILVEPGRFELEQVDISPKPDELLVKIASCGLCNWELNHWRGLLGTYPQTLGHEWSGIIVEVGNEVEGFAAGDAIATFPPPDNSKLEGFSEYATVSTMQCIKIPKTVDIKYALAEPLKCIITVLRATAPEAGDNGVLLGCGPMGLWCTQALSGNLFNSLIAVDIDDERLKKAKSYGATHTINPQNENVLDRLNDITDGHFADFVIEGTGIPAMMNTGLTYLKHSGRGRLIMMSSHEEITKEFSFKMAMEKSAMIKVAHAFFSHNQYDDLRRAVLMVEKEVFRIKEIVTHEFKLEDINIAFNALENKPAGYLKGIVVP